MASDVLSSRAVRLRDYRYPGELVSLVLTFFILVSLYGVGAIFFPTTWSSTVKTLLITLAGLSVYIITVKLQHRAAFGTMVRVSPRQFPHLDQIAHQVAERLSAVPVPVYVKRSSEMNIYTLGLWQRPIIVVTSSLVDQMTTDSLQFFIGREVGHIQAGHTWLRTLLKPLGSDVPLIGKLLNSFIFGDWMNRAEFTSDRAGFIACRSLTSAVSTMLKFGVGVRLFEQLDIREFLEQINEVRDMRGHLTEIVAEMPYLTQRVRALVRYALSDQFRALVPDRQAHTQILKALPEAFVSSQLSLEEMAALPIERQLQAQKQREEKAVAPTPVTPVEKETPADTPPVTSVQRETPPENMVTKAEIILTDDENPPDPKYRLMMAGSKLRYVLRRQRTRIGRNSDNHIVLEADRISRYHAEIVRDGEVLRLLDLHSRNGVWLNDQRVRSSVPLTPGDVVRIGSQEFTFTVQE